MYIKIQRSTVLIIKLNMVKDRAVSFLINSYFRMKSYIQLIKHYIIILQIMIVDIRKLKDHKTH